MEFRLDSHTHTLASGHAYCTLLEMVRAAADRLRRAGVRDVEVKLYEGMRHEILNEPGRARVYTEVVGWIEEHACQSTS